jgi:hypothetical protein
MMYDESAAGSITRLKSIKHPLTPRVLCYQTRSSACGVYESSCLTQRSLFELSEYLEQPNEVAYRLREHLTARNIARPLQQPPPHADVHHLLLRHWRHQIAQCADQNRLVASQEEVPEYRDRDQ